ncbi:MAG TPA: DsrE family protein [Saprospiraceae bacterium]|nr:DsrE family protein [Saprospiraceae bacterium]
MKKQIHLLSTLLFISTMALAQSKPIKIVFDLTSGDTLDHQVALRHISLEAKAHPDAQLELVVYGKAMPIFVKDQSTVAKGIQELASNKNVSLRVCAQTMKHYNITTNDLLPGVQTVPDGILEVVAKQGEGWGYIKESH